MESGSEAPCGIDSTPELGLKCQGDGFNQDKACGMCGLLFAANYPIGAMTSAHIAPNLAGNLAGNLQSGFIEMLVAGIFLAYVCRLKFCGLFFFQFLKL